MKRIAVIQFPGSNCERETILALKRVQCEPIPFLWNESTAKLLACDGCVIVGGFSYEDRGRAGIIASLSPVLDAVKQMNQDNKPILGICNGAQILVESGLVPGLKNNTLGMALTTNKRIQNNHILGTGFYNSWSYVKNSSSKLNAFNKYLEQPIYIPVAHAEGRFVIPATLLEELKLQEVGMLQYCDAKCQVHSEFPTNPNGSTHNLAAVCNIKGNIMAIMPHPERIENGDVIFSSMRDYKSKPKAKVLSYIPNIPKPKTYTIPANTTTLSIELLITDNAAFSIEQALKDFDIEVKVQRRDHWQISSNKDLTQQLITSEALFNPRKEKLRDKVTAKNNMSFLVQDKENIEGNYKLEHLKQQFPEINSLTKGVIWSISGDEKNLNQAKKLLLERHILYNPYVTNCYIYED